MSIRERSVWHSLDWFTVGIYVLMVTAGWFVIYGASYEFDSANLFEPTGRMGSQLIWIGVAFSAAFVVLMLDKDFFETLSYLIYAFFFLLLILTIFIAPDIKGSHSWLIVGPVHIQPAEFAKFATALAVAKFINSYHQTLFTFRKFMIAVGMIAAPILCILLQKETGSALVYVIFILVLYREGMSGFVLLTSVCAVIFCVIILRFGDSMTGATPTGELIVSLIILIITCLATLFIHKDRTTTRILPGIVLLASIAGWAVSRYMQVNYVWVITGIIGVTVCYLLFLSLKNLAKRYALVALFAVLSVSFLFSVNYVFDHVLEPHQQTRIRVSLGLENDPGGASYNVNQSKIAIGSGGLTGKGFLNGTQTKLKYVPEQDTDFIFCTVGEEFGFLGSLAVLALFGALILRLIALAEQQDSIFGRAYGYAVASIFFFHLAINIGMVTGLTPVIGIPLPFFSYGGSSLLSFTLLLMVFLRIDAARKEK
ncbi:MAG: rod shape-determining protein RodA [Tannerella sp.]|jgi:rod shape determining protein RodA|nr:rod shape-determining protein RodA [Tannerella sp.]